MAHLLVQGQRPVCGFVTLGNALAQDWRGIETALEDQMTSRTLAQNAQHEVPFEAPTHRLARTRSFVLRLPRRREKPLSETGVAIFLAIYALGLYAVGFHDPGYLLLSWLMTGPLAVTVYLTFDGRGSLMNPYTLFFAAIVLGSFAAYVLAGNAP